MQPSSIDVQAFCKVCDKMVTAFVLVRRDELPDALSGDIKVMHTADSDHIWNLTDEEKSNLRKRIADRTI